MSFGAACGSALGAPGPMGDGGEHAPGRGLGGGQTGRSNGEGAQGVPGLGREAVRLAGKAPVTLGRQATPRACLAPSVCLKVSMAASGAGAGARSRAARRCQSLRGRAAST